MEVIELIEEMCNICEKLRQEGYRIRFVPTMGALHDGHASLIRRANTDKNAQNYNKNNNSSSSACLIPLVCNDNNHRQPEVHPRNTTSSELVRTFHSQMRILNSPTTTAAATTLSTTEEKNINYRQGYNDVENVLTYKQREKIVVIVSIFVNPKQFNNPNDFADYPNKLESDLEICRKLNVDFVFVPTSDQMYPIRTKQSIKAHSNNSFNIKDTLINHCMIQPPNNRLAVDLEGESRPGHFQGMLTVVCKLFNIVKPHDAYFGEKDYQQLILVQNMVLDLNMNIQISAGKTIRDSNLLPLSSRNLRLKEDERKIASIMYKILCDAKDAIESKQLTPISSYFTDSVNDLNDIDLSNNNSIGCKDLDTIIFASMLTTVSLNLSDDCLDFIDVNYLELRCAKDITRVVYVENFDFEGFDCENGCIESQLNSTDNFSPILKARLLISIIVSEVRLLDNIEVSLNLHRR